MTDKMDEKVAVLPRALFEGYGFPGLLTAERYLMLFYRLIQQVEYRRRGDVEEDETLLQIIPYMYIYNNETDHVFMYRRSVKSGENRLHGKYTIGIGGHLNEEDGRYGSLALVSVGAHRELFEEVSFDPSFQVTSSNMRPVGLMVLDTSPVDRVHLGVVIRIEYEGVVTPNGEEVEDYQWVPFRNLPEFPLENWSKEVARIR